jgi:uncharacterized secreted protein with C-terminal beta-propeller domain
MRIPAVVASSILLSLAACSSATDDAAGDGRVGRAANSSGVAQRGDSGPGRSISLPSSCDELLALLKERALDQVTPWGLMTQASYANQIVRVTSGVVPTESPVEDSSTARTSMSPAPIAAAQSDAAPAPATSSGTNTQVDGVDEGDLVETDGRYVYVLNNDGLHIVDIDTNAVVSSMPRSEFPNANQMMLVGTRLAVVEPVERVMWSTRVVVIDVVRPSAPTIVDRIEFEGSSGGVRGVGSQVRVALTSDAGAQVRFVQPRNNGESDRDEALRLNKQAISDSTIDQWLPRLAVGSSTPQSAIECSKVAVTDQGVPLSMSWVATVDLGDPTTAMGAVGVIGQGALLYSDAASVVVAAPTVPVVRADVVDVRPEPASTALYWFDINGDGTGTYRASGSVAGSVRSQFSLDIYDGNLRVVSTSDGSEFGSSGPSSAVRVLTPQGDALVEVGSVDGLGRNEQVQSVRFLGDRAYVTTFRRVDPLYVVDLSTPSRPVVAGELKMPGYSSYLHPLGDHQVMGIGPDGDEDGRLRGTKMSLFDATDATNPRRVSEIGIGSTSEVDQDHHAFLWWDKTRTAIVPTGAWLTNPDGGVVVVDERNGRLVERGRVGLQRDAIIGSDPVRRSLIVNGTLVLVSGLGVQTVDLATVEPITWIAFNGR